MNIESRQRSYGSGSGGSINKTNAAATPNAAHRHQQQPPTGTPWSSTLNAACYLFQPDSFLCGGMNSLVPDSPLEVKGFYFPKDLACGQVTGGGGASGAIGTEEEEAKQLVKNAMKKFEPHLCEDREFFVINNGTTSVDAESLSTPSMGEEASGRGTASESSSFKVVVEANTNTNTTNTTAREGVPSFEQDHILEAPFPMLMYKDQEEPETIIKAPGAVPIVPPPKLIPGQPQTRHNYPDDESSHHREEEVVKEKQSPPKTKKKTHHHHHHPDEERLRKLLSLYPDAPEPDLPPPPKHSQGLFSGRIQSFVVPSCVMEESSKKMIQKSQQPAEQELVVVPSPGGLPPQYCGGKIDDEMKEYWTEKFNVAANKVIKSKSSRRCMEILDPTIPRSAHATSSSSPSSRSPPHGSAALRGRRRYRKVLKKYRKHRILVLIMDPTTKLYEMLELPYRPDETTVADVLIMARIQTTDDRLRYREYVGLCRPDLNPPPPPPSPSPAPTVITDSSGNTRRSPTTTTTQDHHAGMTSLQTPPRNPLLPPRVSRVTAQHNDHSSSNNSRSSSFNCIGGGGHDERREDDTPTTTVTEDTTATSNSQQQRSGESPSSMLLQVTDPDELVWSLLTPSASTSRSSSPISVDCGAAFPPVTSVLPYFTLPLLGDIVVTIPKGYTGEEVSKFAQTILQTPLFLRWMHQRYVTDLQRANDELLSRAAGAVNGGTRGGATTMGNPTSPPSDTMMTEKERRQRRTMHSSSAVRSY